MTANMVPVWSITRSSVIGGEDGSRPISFSATTTWAELETGSSSANPCTIARMMTLTTGIDDLFQMSGSRGYQRGRTDAVVSTVWAISPSNQGLIGLVLPDTAKTLHHRRIGRRQRPI